MRITTRRLPALRALALIASGGSAGAAVEVVADYRLGASPACTWSGSWPSARPQAIG